MSRKSLVLIAILLVVTVGGFAVWRIQDTQAKAAKLESEILKGLSSEDLGLLVKSQLGSEPESIQTMKDNVEARSSFLKKIKETLALAAQARREGLTEDPNFKINLEFKKNLLLQTLYIPKFDREQLKALLTPEEIQAVWGNPENEAQFSKDIKALRAVQNVYAESRGAPLYSPEVKGEKLEKARKEWAVTKILSDKAKADVEFMQRPEIQLRFRILEAGILSSDYLNKHWSQKIKATDAEIKAYLGAHPEYDLSKKREKAQAVLQRAKAGEDFAKLAAEFSEDRSTKNKGGLYENVGTNIVWEQVESAALALEKGQVAEKLVESKDGLHIVKLENKTLKSAKDGSQTVTFSVRHILLQNAFEEPDNNQPGIPPPFLKPEEIAKTAVEKEKYASLVADMIGRNQIAVPDDFAL